MTITESLNTVVQFPIEANFITKVCLDRSLTASDEYTATIGVSQAYELATADIYYYVGTSPTLKEQEISIQLTDESKQNLINLANTIYVKYSDAKADLSTNLVGHIGSDWSDIN